MIIEFDNEWQLQTRGVNSGTVWFVVNHRHQARYDKGDRWQGVNIMIYNEKLICTACGVLLPDVVHGYVRLIKWSMDNDH